MDKQIVCVDCGEEFEFSAGEQSFYKYKGLTEPKRCKNCRSKKRADNQKSVDEGHVNKSGRNYKNKQF